MKIGILTYHRSYNYGAFLQAYALVKRLQNEGFDAELIDFNMPKSMKMYRLKAKDPYRLYLKNKLYKMFLKNVYIALSSEKFLFSDSCEDFKKLVKNKYDIIIAGSDELWKVDGVRGFPNPYWLVGDLGCTKVSYAVSARRDFSKLSTEKQGSLRSIVNDFDFLGVRDTHTYTQVSNYTNDDSKNKVVLCCDPTFAYNFNGSRDRGKKILTERYKIDPQKKCVALMTNDEQLVKALRNKFKKVQFISLYNFHLFTHNLADLTPFEWIDVISAVDFLATNFFHGTCFAIQNNTSFISVEIRESNDEQSKIYDLLSRENLLDRYVNKENPGYINAVIESCQKALVDENPCDFSVVSEHQEALFTPFLEYLKTKSLGVHNEIS